MVLVFDGFGGFGVCVVFVVSLRCVILWCRVWRFCVLKFVVGLRYFGCLACCFPVRCWLVVLRFCCLVWFCYLRWICGFVVSCGFE